MTKFLDEYDRQQAFSVGFALAARDWGLNQSEYALMCKRAADALTTPTTAGAPQVVPPSVLPPQEQKQQQLDSSMQARAAQLAANKNARTMAAVGRTPEGTPLPPGGGRL